MPPTDRAVLVTEAYADARDLAARQAIYRWQQPRHDLPGEVVAAVTDHQGLLLDVGCGNGAYLSRLRNRRRDLTCLGMDLSVGMAPDIVADMAALPLRDQQRQLCPRSNRSWRTSTAAGRRTSRHCRPGSPGRII